MKYANCHFAALGALAFLASCGGGSVRPASMSGPMSQSAANGSVSDDPVRLGSAFTVGSTSYTPADVMVYDEVGYASYYGSEMAGRATANGEMFNPGGVSAAHKTLAMPTYVEVTALDTGKTILVRVNDRGPFANDRLIDLSEGAAQQLGIVGQGVAGVRVRKVNPPEQERAVLRAGSAAAERIETPDSLLRVLREKLAKMPRPSGARSAAPVIVRPAPVGAAPRNPAPVSGDGRFIREGSGSGPAPRATTPMPRASTPAPTQHAAAGGYVVQIAAFSDRSRAVALAKKLGAKVAVSADGKLFRVRYGPYATEEEGQRGLATAKAKGYPQARVYHE